MASAQFLSTDVLVIGAGQAALALANHLRRLPHRFHLVDRHARVGDSWRKRHDSLTLFTPRSHSALPGRAVPGDPDGFPTKDEIADYLEAYAGHFEFPVLSSSEIISLRHSERRFLATTVDGRTLASRAVVLANGAFQLPRVPDLARDLAPDVRQFSATTYRCPSLVPPGNVLVVGDGATGRQIALELAASHPTFLATGHRRRISPRQMLGRSVFWWMERTGLLTADRDSLVGRALRKADPFPGRELRSKHLTRRGVVLVPRLASARGSRARFGDGSEIDIATVIWAAGYREDTSWVHIPELLDSQGRLIHDRGVTPVSGLYVLGRSWQSNRGSALLLGVTHDAREIAGKIDTWLRSAEVRLAPPFFTLRENVGPIRGRQLAVRSR